MIAAQGDLFPVQAGLWLAVVLVAVGFGLLAIRRIRRRLLDQPGAQDTGLTLDDLRRQRDQGIVTPLEYEAIRRQIVARMTGAGPSTSRGTADKVVQARRVS